MHLQRSEPITHETLLPVVGALLILAGSLGWPHTSAASEPSVLPRCVSAAVVPAVVWDHATLPGLRLFEDSTTVALTVQDDWLGFDKVQHFAFSFLIAIGGQYTLVNKLAWQESHAAPVSLGTSALIGLLKEYYDLHYGPRRYFSKRDLVANGLGLLFAAGFILL